MANATCSLPDCAKPAKRGGYCYGHYMKNWRYGTPTPMFAPRWEDLRGTTFGHLTVIDRDDTGRWRCACDCGSEALVRTGDLNRGSVTTCGDKTEHWRRQDIGYSMAHDRVRTDRGRVQTYDCVGCSKPAQHWSYDHSDFAEMHAVGLSARPVAYSANPDHYSPRCAKCHKRFDLDRIDALPLAGLTPGG
jgi:hypothetical protein